MDSIIKVQNLTAKYDGHLVLDSLDFEIERGEVFVILGGSGCGKSTLLKHLIGLYKPHSGSIFIDGYDIVAANAKTKNDILRKIGVMYQSGALFGSMTLLQNIALPLRLFTDLPRDAIEAIAYCKLRLVSLDTFANHFPSEISGGMQKRAAIARAMALDPQVLFLDEPSAGLDPITSADLDQLILQLASSLKITFVVVTHELASIYTIATRVIMLDKRTKKIIATGCPNQLRETSEDPWVRQFFKRETSGGKQ